MTDHHAATGHVRVEERAKERVWVAEYQVGDGARTRKTLGPAKQNIEDYQSALLRTPVARGKKMGQPPRPLARTTVRKRMLVLTAILERARALGWLAVNPAQEVRIVADPGADPDFNVLAPMQVEDVAAAMTEIADDELPLMRNGEVDTCALAKMRECRILWAEAVRLAAYTGLRFGELRDLRWRNIDWDGRVLHVRRNTPTSARPA